MTKPEARPRLLLRPELLSDGFDDVLITAHRRRGEWHGVRPGALVSTDEWTELHYDDRQLLVVRSTAAKLGPDSVVSHISAARLHGLPVWRPPKPELVHVIRDRAKGGYRKGWVHAHPGLVIPGMSLVIDEVPVTTVARTVIDSACMVSYGSAVAMADHALKRELVTGPELTQMAQALVGRKGIAGARRALAACDGRSESVGESLSRLVLAGAALPAPDLQFPVLDATGRRIARTDFAWETLRTVGEFDGRIKYGRLRKPGESEGDAVWREKLREDAIRALGWEVVRWTWSDLVDPAALAHRIQDAFARGSRFAR